MTKFQPEFNSDETRVESRIQPIIASYTYALIWTSYICLCQDLVQSL